MELHVWILAQTENTQMALTARLAIVPARNALEAVLTAYLAPHRNYWMAQLVLTLALAGNSLTIQIARIAIALVPLARRQQQMIAQPAHPLSYKTALPV